MWISHISINIRRESLIWYLDFLTRNEVSGKSFSLAFYKKRVEFEAKPQEKLYFKQIY